MKNIVVFITPQKQFWGEYHTLAHVFIDNSLDLGWKKEDIMLITNFRYKYNGVKTYVVGDTNFCEVRPRSIKTSIIPHLAEIGLVQEGELYWNHDLDAFQMNPFNGIESELDSVDIGLTDYGWKSRWCMGSYFFKKSAYDVFSQTCPLIFENVEDEDALQRIQGGIRDFDQRHKRLNITYNFGMRRVEENWQRAEHPVKVVHFHPTYKLVRTWDVFVLGKNGLGHPIVNDRLKAVFKHHGVGYGI